ncbi:histidine phosphatase family protein [Nevskia soli]|uniref:histidine phosphatase family protein n=1 Tax=Nevskia soli TaxID=418856 RepID=UPI0004A73200|nr:histidine phosphatase family protein [Nevskia soli]
MGAIYLIRHGQASFGKADYDELSPTGVEQGRVLGLALRTRVPQVDTVVTGAMKRHRQTAASCLEAMQLAAPTHDVPGFREYDHDEIIVRFEPRFAKPEAMMAELAKMPEPHRVFQEMFGKAMERWIDGGHDADYGESWTAFRERCNRALSELIRSLGPSKTALVFTSGGVISAICRELLQFSEHQAYRLNLTLANCGVTKIIYSERARYLSTLNEHAHFEGAQHKLITYR